MAITINGTKVTTNRINGVNTSQENINGVKIYPDEVFIQYRVNGGAWQETKFVGSNPWNGLDNFRVYMNNPVMTIDGLDATLNFAPGTMVEINPLNVTRIAATDHEWNEIMDFGTIPMDIYVQDENTALITNIGATIGLMGDFASLIYII